MTDNEIIEALEYCNQRECEECYCGYSNPRTLVGASFDLINRQKAEIERYKGVIKILEKDVKTAKAEAIKEFAERLKSRLRFYYQNQGMLEKEFCLIHIDNLVKEMTEDL